MRASVYLNFEGQCEAAFQYYARVLGGTIETMSPYEGTPAAEQMPADKRKQIIHARLRAGDSVLMGSDAPPGFFKPRQGFNVSLEVDTPAEAERVFAALSQGGTITVPMAQSFFASRFGMTIDKFGIPWIVLSDAAG